LSPEAISDLTDVIRNWVVKSSVIKPTLRRRENGPNYWYRLQLIEDFGSVDDAGNHYPSSKLDECISWVAEKLTTWPNCTRKSWDMWDFKSKKDAEKFITLFHLSWTQ
jgi:hypothetical protein